jgi:hypothetical protein
MKDRDLMQLEKQMDGTQQMGSMVAWYYTIERFWTTRDFFQIP